MKSLATGRAERGRNTLRNTALGTLVALAGGLVVGARGVLAGGPITALAAPPQGAAAGRRAAPESSAPAPGPAEEPTRERSIAQASSAAPAVLPLATRAVQAAGELALEVGRDADASRFRGRARASARSLGAGARSALLERVRETNEDEELIALAELLRHPPLALGASSGDALPRAALDALRRAARERELAPERFAAAAAALAAHGNVDDRAGLVEALAEGSPRVSAAAAAGLHASPEADAGPALLAVARGAHGARPDAAALALATIEALASDLDLDGLVPEVAAIATDAASAAGVRARAVAAVVALDPQAARRTLSGWVADASVPDETARAAALTLARGEPLDQRALESLLERGELSPRRAATVAALLLQHGDGNPHAAAVAALARAARQGATPLERRAAVLALGGLERPGRNVMTALAGAAGEDPDADVRDAAARALARTDREGRYRSVRN